MRRCYQLKFNTAKRGFLRFEISADISFVYIIRSYLWSSCAPLSAQCATFSQFGMKLIFSPQSGKTFNDIPVERDPLSAHAPLSPKGKAFYPGICVPLSPKGKALIGTACHSPRRGKLFCLVRRLFLFDSIKTSGRTFCLRLNQNEREDF